MERRRPAPPARNPGVQNDSAAIRRSKSPESGGADISRLIPPDAGAA